MKQSGQPAYPSSVSTSAFLHIMLTTNSYLRTLCHSLIYVSVLEFLVQALYSIDFQLESLLCHLPT